MKHFNMETSIFAMNTNHAASSRPKLARRVPGQHGGEIEK